MNPTLILWVVLLNILFEARSFFSTNCCEYLRDSSRLLNCINSTNSNQNIVEEIYLEGPSNIAILSKPKLKIAVAVFISQEIWNYAAHSAMVMSLYSEYKRYLYRYYVIRLCTSHLK